MIGGRSRGGGAGRSAWAAVALLLAALPSLLRSPLTEEPVVILALPVPRPWPFPGWARLSQDSYILTGSAMSAYLAAAWGIALVPVVVALIAPRRLRVRRPSARAGCSPHSRCC